jgi:hypothetical protein
MVMQNIWWKGMAEENCCSPQSSQELGEGRERERENESESECLGTSHPLQRHAPVIHFLQLGFTFLLTAHSAGSSVD